MKKRIFNSIFFVSLGIIAVITALTTYIFFESYSNNQINELNIESELVETGIENEGVAYLEGMSFDSFRVTWIDDKGNVIYDTEADNSQMENHLQREEIQEAISTGYGQSKRYSSTILKESIYVAHLLKDNTILRLSITQNSIFYLVFTCMYPVYLIILVVFIISLIISHVLSNKIIEPLKNVDFSNPLDDNAYEELKPVLEHLENQHNQLKKDKEEIEHLSIVRQEFTANASHELKTPLHIISGYAELIANKIAKVEDMPEFGKKIYKEASRMNAVVGDILKLSKLESDTNNTEFKSTDLKTVIYNVVDSLSEFASERNVKLNVDAQDININSNQDILYSMIYNLVDNAIKYNKENGSVTIKLVKDNETPVMTITDTGIGIPEDQLDRVFERFYRVDKSHSREVGGTGLGLSIVKHSAVVLGVEIKVESKLDEGTTFTLNF